MSYFKIIHIDSAETFFRVHTNQFPISPKFCDSWLSSKNKHKIIQNTKVDWRFQNKEKDKIKEKKRKILYRNLDPKFSKMSDLTTSFHAFAQPLKSKVTQLTEKSLLYQHYPTLKKATNSELGDTPGYVYEELVQITYSDLTMATQLAIYLADCLGIIHILRT